MGVRRWRDADPRCCRDPRPAHHPARHREAPCALPTARSAARRAPPPFGSDGVPPVCAVSRAHI